MVDDLSVVMSWYQLEPFKTLIGVVIGGLLAGLVSLATSWWLKRLEIRAKADALMLAFQAEVNALRLALRADVEMAQKAMATSVLSAAPWEITYPRVIFERNAGQIGDLRDRVLISQLAGFYTALDRLESFGAAKPPLPHDFPYRFMAALGSSFYLAVLLDIRLTAQTARLGVADFTVTVSGQDAQDQNLARKILEAYGDKRDRRVLGDSAPEKGKT